MKKIEKCLVVSANLPQIGMGLSARDAEDKFEAEIQRVIKTKGGCVSNCDVGWTTDSTSDSIKFLLSILVWREADSPFVDGPLGQAKMTETALSSWVKPIKKVLTKKYRDVEFVIRTTTTTVRKLK